MKSVTNYSKSSGCDAHCSLAKASKKGADHVLWIGLVSHAFVVFS